MAGTVAVVGAGLMGSGIAQVAAQAGYDVVLADVSDDALERGLASVRASYARVVKKGALGVDEAEAAFARIRATTSLEDCGPAHVVVEAVPEDLALKRDVFAALDRLCAPDAVLATNTSAIPVTAIAAATARPESVVGTHFFSPVPVMRLCELVRGQRTSDATLQAARGFAERVGKTCVVVERDVAGFVTTRLLCAFVMEAVRLVESGVASAEDVDLACRLGFGHAMGPLATTDLTGLDVLRSATLAIAHETGEPRFHPPELLSRLVDAGHLGRKSGQGFHAYE